MATEPLPPKKKGKSRTRSAVKRRIGSSVEGWQKRKSLAELQLRKWERNKKLAETKIETWERELKAADKKLDELANRPLSKLDDDEFAELMRKERGDGEPGPTEE